MTTFGPLFVPEELLDAVSGRAWLEAMLEFESALARAETTAGIVPEDAAAAIAKKCAGDLYDFDDLLKRGRSVGSPPEPLVQALRDAVGGDAARYIHWGATSQDVMDTASMLVARRALDLILAELDGLAAALAALAESQRSTPMAARTLLQQALPTTFGFKVAGWLVALLESRNSLEVVRTQRLAVQLGGAVGTLAAIGERGPEVLRALADDLGLVEPVLPWHTNRTRIADLGAALATTAGVLGKIGLDVVLLAQTEVGELREGANGGSSTLHRSSRRPSLRSTNGLPEPGTPSGRLYRERWRTRAEQHTPSRWRSPHSRSTPSGCAPISRQPMASSSPNA
jgi:3-carboxy-cis,cis-muconate cycloisomerase